MVCFKGRPWLDPHALLPCLSSFCLAPGWPLAGGGGALGLKVRVSVTHFPSEDLLAEIRVWDFHLVPFASVASGPVPYTMWQSKIAEVTLAKST